MTKIVGVEPVAPAAAEHAEYPKWVVPHASHLADDGWGLGFADHHVDRAGTVTVLVTDAAQEQAALAPKKRARNEPEKSGA